MHSPLYRERQAKSALHLYEMQLVRSRMHVQYRQVRRCNPSSLIAYLVQNVVASSAIVRGEPRPKQVCDGKTLQRSHLGMEQLRQRTSLLHLSHRREPSNDRGDSHPIFRAPSNRDRGQGCIRLGCPCIQGFLQCHQPLKRLSGLHISSARAQLHLRERDGPYLRHCWSQG